MLTAKTLIRLAVLLVLACCAAAHAKTSATAACRINYPEPFPVKKPFDLYDPRSGLLLRVEPDGRHMSAKTRDGELVWRRDVFFDATRLPFVPPQFQGEPQLSRKEIREMERRYIASRRIDRIGIQPVCAINHLNRELPQVRSYYVLAGMGTHEYYLINPKTGDLRLEEVN